MKWEMAPPFNLAPLHQSTNGLLLIDQVLPPSNVAVCTSRKGQSFVRTVYSSS